MNKRWKSVMVAVRDLDRSAQGLLSKAAQLAKRFDAELEVVHVFAHPYMTGGRLFERLKQDTTDEVLAPLREQLDRRVRPIVQPGLRVYPSMIWDYPASDAIVRQVLRSRPDVLIIESPRRGRLDRWFLTNTDWELIRSCPCPLWIIKSKTLPSHPSVFAALDPSHAHAKSARLDSAIPAAAGQVVTAMARRWKADLLVMGAVSRSGLRRVFIGNTAERVLDAVEGDVLVVKPPSFKCPVSRMRPGVHVVR